ncbi:hypothetical protein L1987_75017 [Smallanthus sonchifolius]|uniref:Uncharacterized protein n=1 Tax=Smallanthus sonchifolius TaxID=185202 RepID=A0ACB9A4J2_9ASTR|nr:hypothetical protein L1987_75017 [Smallanthus sonchifolius]
MQPEQIDDLGFCPSFKCYSSDSLSSTAAGRISRQLQQEHAARFHDVDEEEFEFSLVIGDKVSSPEVTDSDGRTVFPLFNRDLIQNEARSGRVLQQWQPEGEEAAVHLICPNFALRYGFQLYLIYCKYVYSYDFFLL